MVESALRKSNRVRPSEVDENKPRHEQQQPPQHASVRRSSSRRKRPVTVHHNSNNNININPENVDVAELEKEMMQNILGRRQRRTSALGHTCLDSIKNHKSLIAEMRPTRRRIKWQNNISDWERANLQNKNNTKMSRISVGVKLEDLHIHGAPKKAPEEEESEQLNETSILDLGCNLGDSVDELEDAIEQLFESIRRLSNQVDELDEEAENLRLENKTIRQELMDLPIPQTPSRRRSTEQLTHTVERVTEKTSEMEEQITLMNFQREKTENATAALLQQLAEAEAEDVDKEAAGKEEENSGLVLNEEDDYVYSDDSHDNECEDDMDDNQELSQDDEQETLSSAIPLGSSSEASEIISTCNNDEDDDEVPEFATLEYFQCLGVDIPVSGRPTSTTQRQQQQSHPYRRGPDHHYHTPAQHQQRPRHSPRMVGATPAAA